MQGDGKNVRPKDKITRAEVVKLLDNMISDYITESGTATPKGTGIVIVKASGVTLNKAKLSSTVVLGGKAGEVKATDCEITGKVVEKFPQLCSGDQRQHEYGRLDRWFSPAVPLAAARLHRRHRVHTRSPRDRKRPRAWAYSTTI